MSLSDINKIVASLQSTKIKERNDALNLLETITVSKFRLSLKQFKQVTLAVLKLIDHESQIYINNKSSTVDSRLSQASYYLRLLTDKSIEDTRVNLKYKVYLDLILGIRDQYFIADDEILPPCSIDFIKTIASILNLGYVKEHLNRKDWGLIFNFLVKLISTALDDSDASGTINGSNEKLLVELFAALQNLLQCENDISVNYLHLYDNDNYFKLLGIIDRTSKLIKKENVIVIIIFRIINKLVITTSTENFKFVNKLGYSGTAISWMWMTKIHKVHIDDEENEVFVYNIGVLIQNLLVETRRYGISAVNKDQTWLQLKSMYLSSQNYKSWLLILGVLLLYPNSSGKTRKQKLGTIADSISNSNGTLEFCNKLIHAKDSSDTQLLGLKLLIFFLEVYPSVPPSKSQKKPRAEETEDSGDTTIGETTMMDLLVTAPDDPGSSRIRNSHAGQLLKLALLLLKEHEVSSIACNVIYKLVFERDGHLTKLIDDSVLIQLETLIDLSEINGPSRISQESFQFWYACIIGSRSELVQEEPIDKKNSGLDKKFIHWIAGSSITYNPNIPNHVSYDTDLLEPFYFAKNYQDLGSFLCLKTTPEILTEPTIEVNSIIANEKIDVILAKTNATFKVFDNDQVSSSSLFKWIIVLLHVVAKVRPLQYFAHEVNALEYQISAGLDSFNDSALDYDEIVGTMKVCNRFLPTDKEIRRRFHHRFALDKLIDTLKFDYLEATKRLRRDRTRKTHLQKSLPIEIQGKNMSDTVAALASYVENLSTEKFLPAHENSVLEDAPLLKLLRLINDKLLTTQLFDRNEVTLITVARFLSVLAPVWIHSSDSSVSTDFYDLATWMYESGAKEFIITENSIVEYCKFLSQLLIQREDRTFSMTDVNAELLVKFSRSPNNIKNNLAPSFIELLMSLPSIGQDQLYNNIFEKFISPSQSVEVGGTFCKLITALSAASSKILRLALMNLLESSAFAFFIPYLEICLQDLCKTMNLPNSNKLFKAFQYEILRTWRNFDSIESFPYMLFSYSDLNTFYRDNYRVLVAVTLSSKTKNLDASSKFINRLAVLNHNDAATLVAESVSLIIPLSYTSDGVRNSIFDILGAYLQDCLKQELAHKLSLITLELIKFIDVSKESSMLEYFKQNETATALINTTRSSHVENFGGMVISFDSAAELLTRLVKKYSSEKDYWSSKQVYFIIRRISILLKSVTTLDQKVLHLRRLKLALILGGEKAIDFEVTRLLVTLLCPMMNEEGLLPDIVLILLLLKDLYLHGYPHEKSLSLIIHIINSLLSSHCSIRENPLLGSLEDFIAACDKDRAITQIAESGVEILKGQRVTINSSVIELCLEDSISVDVSPVSLISQIFNHVEKMDHLGGKLPVVERLLSLDKHHLETFSDKFKLWIANYLSDFYIKGGTKEDIKALTIHEYDDIPVDSFEEEVRYFNYTLEKIIGYTKTDNYEAAACAESLLGVLIRKFTESERDVSKVLNFDTIYETFSDNILPMDFHTCMVLNDKADVTFLGDRLSTIIDDFETLLRDDADLWCTKLYLSILQELASYTSIASLLTTFVITVPEFAKLSLPTLVCNYLVMKGKSAENMIIRLLDVFLAVPTKSESSKRIFLQIVILIRVGAKYANRQVFNTVFANINKLEYYQLASEVKLFKTAMMIFEDAVSDDNYERALEDHYLTLQTVYESIDDDDLLSGLPERTTMDYAISMINRVGNSMEQLRFSSAGLDTSMMLNQQPSYNGLVSAMTNAGLLGVSRALSKNANFEGNEDEQYEWSWKLSKWDLPVAKNAQKENAVIYKTLKQIHDYPLNVNEICESSLLSAINQKNSARNSSVKEFKLERLSWLKTISTVVSISEIAKLNNHDLRRVTSKFSNDTKWFSSVEFDMFENLLLARQATFQLLSERATASLSEESIWLGALGDLVRYNNLARINNEQQKMVTSTMLIEEIGKKFTESQAALIKNIGNLSSFQTAQTLWTQGNTSVPVLLMKDLYRLGGVDIPAQNLTVDKCLIQAMMVDWMSKSRQELASSIMEKYVLPTAELSRDLPDLQQQSQTFEILARFCEEQYKSKPAVEQIANIDKRVNMITSEIEEIKHQVNTSRLSEHELSRVKKYYRQLRDQLGSEQKSSEEAKKSHRLMADKAVEYYLKSISVSDFHEGNLDKFFALWLEQAGNEQLHKNLEKELLNLPSYKLISWCPQLVSRLTTERTVFQETLKRLIYNMCMDHPHHSLYLLIALRLQKAAEAKTDLLNPRRLAADSIWDKLAANKDYVQKTLATIDGFVHKSIQLAAAKANKSRGADLTKLSCGGYWLHDLPGIPPPTKTIKVDPTKKYDHVPVLAQAESRISIATSGISMPKIVTFLLSDGTEHKILFKLGSDDLRQDSIMEQVFNKVNNIFAKDRECNKRALRIRTYNVVPLSPNTGIIEFVPDSIAFSDAILPYHEKMDLVPLKTAREIMKTYQSSETKLRIFEYQKLEQKIKPVLRFFFQRNFLTADSWFESRMKYTHGTATNSIVGHILGLGDRHCNNILLDTRSGEPIHIDLGVSFDQGKSLPVPETVPFRLSRDIVDGFGVTGVEGVFKKSCEHTFRVLQSNKEHILSILDVLKWDPLYHWSISPLKKKKLQNEEGTVVSSGDTNRAMTVEKESEADKAIRSVVEKLTANGLSTEATVRELIQEATSSLNLALIYLGWSPFY
ncbi:Serine/threonine-protein kinase TEL1 [Candida viswanathii]|uniref:Serine/threonine-protein kinase Tel1 n=1 Tax=Candida viswanathii TaxID=5486 RepID=A0A367XV16_9ASCO|nr:Serine/threonine-protein kinase TEL1 [Candida viswanathii]